ncbi:hypothetical protein NMY22_g14110 [Coprinellus aureogranulatus]|nr:hypothetical protein NMY22_g14110 [Coprinellus aureogranulatus]
MVAVTAFTLLLSAIAVIGGPSLSLEVEGATSVKNIENFKVNTVITNVGDQPVRILNDPYGTLSKLPTNTFTITNSDGVRGEFIGVKAKYVPKVAADAGAFTTLLAGASVTVTHDLSEAYNLTITGDGTYEVEPTNLFHVVDGSGEISSVRAKVSKIYRSLVSGRLAKARRVTTPQRRALYMGCSAAQQSALVSAAAAAQSYASNTRNYLSGISSSTDRYATWFGTYTSTRKRTVQAIFNAVSTNVFSSFTYDCTCTDPDVYAYVYGDIFGVMHLCGAFWTSPVSGADSMGGTMIHEASHYNRNGGTDDIVYGRPDAMELARTTPASAIRNADNYEFFAENVPALA